MTQTKPFKRSSQDKHTPGPWKYTTYKEHPSGSGGYLIYAPGVKNQIAKLCVQGEYKMYPPTTHPCAEANARLIAAAPETAAERDRLREINRELVVACKKLMRLQHAQFVGSSEGDPINREAIVNEAQTVLGKTKE